MTLAWDILTLADAEEVQQKQFAEGGGEAVDYLVTQQQANNAKQNFDHEKAKLTMAVGAVLLVFCIITAGLRGDLQLVFDRRFKCSRALGHAITLVYITVAVGSPFIVYLTFFA